MFVYLNAFNYDELIGGIVERLGIQDEPLTYEILLKAFKSVSERLKRRKELLSSANEDPDNVVEKLADRYLELVRISPHFNDETNPISFLVELIVGSKPQSVWEGYEIYRILSEVHQEVGNDKDGYCLDIDPDEALAIAETILEHIESNKLIGENPLDSFLEEHIKNQLIGDEPGSLQLEVIDSPGKVVNYGNALITLPLLLAKVEHYEVI
ncbi:hypothetical protein PS2_0042 [Aeromonas phage PS2]|uniref:Uncharacterized protein n=1 Tax=Aeromonas phage PS1 TaxID=2591406 RepID=A0A514TUW3_9CAUD|nr:hypothetical protein PQC64_gp220 [Aeromonas phage PS1]QDJ96802.1 hypothetical protein PS1_0043 [Aeromonas phage PS1]QFR59433.1 hypothetical protein PS2_0042 [Aeromonas phage PS2]